MTADVFLIRSSRTDSLKIVRHSNRRIVQKKQTVVYKVVGPVFLRHSNAPVINQRQSNAFISRMALILSLTNEPFGDSPLPIALAPKSESCGKLRISSERDFRCTYPYQRLDRVSVHPYWRKLNRFCSHGAMICGVR